MHQFDARYFNAERTSLLQSDNFENHPSVVLLPLSSTLVDAQLFRITIQPSDTNGLKEPSQIMIDKITTCKKERIGNSFGTIDHTTMVQVERALAVFIGIA